MRISYKRDVAVNDKGMVRNDTLTLYFDCLISLPAGFIPEDGMKIEWDNRLYTLRGVKPSYATTHVVEFYRAELV